MEGSASEERRAMPVLASMVKEFVRFGHGRRSGRRVRSSDGRALSRQQGEERAEMGVGRSSFVPSRRRCCIAGVVVLRSIVVVVGIIAPSPIVLSIIFDIQIDLEFLVLDLLPHRTLWILLRMQDHGVQQRMLNGGDKPLVKVIEVEGVASSSDHLMIWPVILLHLILLYYS
jgi:hypothetical protein